MKKLAISAFTVIIGAFSLSGCAYFHHNTPTQSEHAQICHGIERKIVFYSNDPNHSVEWSSPAERARLIQSYRDNNCGSKGEEKSLMTPDLD